MLTPVENIVGGDEEDTQRLRKMAVDARDYITSFHWCLPIKAMYFADGVGGVVALFLVEFEGKVGGTDDRLWVVVGDLPSAYFVLDASENAKEALECYCELMDDWSTAVLTGGNMGEVFPVDAAETPGNANSLRNRVAFLRKEIIPTSPEESVVPAAD